MRGWFRRNRWALVALTVLVPAAVLASLSIEWFAYDAAHTQRPEVVAVGASGVYEGSEFTLSDYLVVPWDSETGQELGLLEGTEAVSALIHVDATGSSADEENLVSCDANLVLPDADGDRTWESGSSAIDYYPSGDLVAYCMVNDHVESDWEAVFVVPEGIGQEARLVITDGFDRQYLLLER
jgi:hypothetical protein